MMMGSQTRKLLILWALFATLLVLPDSPTRSFLPGAAATEEEAGECAAGTNEAGECINPDAVAQEDPEESSSTSDEENDPKCPSRQYVIKCAGEYLDTNQNRLLERSELQSAIDKLPWWGKGILNILGSVDKMMAKCDVDGDGAIGMDYDMEHNQETCLATCFKRRAFKQAFFPDCKA